MREAHVGPAPIINLTGFMHQYPDSRADVVNHLQQSIALDAIKSRGLTGLKQYGRFFVLMSAYGLVDSERASLIRSSYFWFRHVDDIVDGDKPLSQAYQTKQEYLWHKRNLAQKLMDQDGGELHGEKEDFLLVDYFQRARKLGINLGEESLAIIDTIMFDEERSRTRRVSSEQELDEYFYKLDFSCIAGALKAGGEECSADTLGELSWAVRTMFNLRDFPKDFKEGIINISREDIDKYGVDLSQCEGKSSIEELLAYGPMRAWYTDQVEKGLLHFENARSALRLVPLIIPTRVAIALNFVRPTESKLKEIKALLQTAQ